MSTISYAIPVCNEHQELKRLLKLLTENKRKQDQIVVQSDLGNTTQEVLEVVEKEYKNQIIHLRYPLKANFSEFKNNLKSACTGDWIVQIDADEMLNESLVQNMHHVLELNSSVEVFSLARINTVDGLTNEHISKWGWNINDRGWVNFPDYQMRIIRNSVGIKWINRVHEKISGHTSHAFLPTDEEYCILHHKNIKRQEAQNNMYNQI